MAIIYVITANSSALECYKPPLTFVSYVSFTIHTDQRSLHELLTEVIETPEQQFYLAKLLDYSYVIVYKPGDQNRVTNTLSRVKCMVITVPHLDFLLKFKEQMMDDEDFQTLLVQVQNSPNEHTKFEVLDGLVFVKGTLSARM
ncbi:hypothetical protein L195_g020590 [Trifolium pratense]|uniref:Uncharacterized protein n=1 Tax=Trifolium pratense TaxID=57577 RepID=A0A2K3N2V6_TRIPR|nr:hypothetical protein L195_g020590 [Trifolium pratense]